MASFIWDRDPNEAYENPYEYEAQEQFVREAEAILNQLFEILMDERYSYTRDDISLDKAIYMLHLDSVDSLRDGIDLIKEKRHRMAARVLRDVYENISLCNYFYFDKSNKSKKNLANWYKDDFVSNRIYRESIKRRLGESQMNSARNYYSQLSKITHRTYRTLAFGYSLGANERLIYEGKYKDNFLVLPQTIAMYMTLFADIIKQLLEEIKINKLISEDEINICLDKSYEKYPVKRRFATPETILMQAKIDEVNMD